jgi:hypothetical protein
VARLSGRLRLATNAKCEAQPCAARTGALAVCHRAGEEKRLHPHGMEPDDRAKPKSKVWQMDEGGGVRHLPMDLAEGGGFGPIRCHGEPQPREEDSVAVISDSANMAAGTFLSNAASNMSAMRPAHGRSVPLPQIEAAPPGGRAEPRKQEACPLLGDRWPAREERQPFPGPYVGTSNRASTRCDILSAMRPAHSPATAQRPRSLRCGGRPARRRLRCRCASGPFRSSDPRPG